MESASPSGLQIARVTNLLNRVMLAMDSGDGAAFAACFAAGGRCEIAISGAAAEGREALESLCAGIHGRFCAGPDLMCRHWESNICVSRGTPGSGFLTNRSYWKALNGGEIISTGMHDDTLVCVDGEWKIATRVITHCWNKTTGHIHLSSSSGTRLMAAVNGDGDDEAVRRLLTSLGGSGSGAAAVLDWRDVNGKSRTALHVAAGRGRGAVVRMLVEAGASVNLGDSNGETALDIAVSRGEEAAAAVLRELGGVQGPLPGGNS